MPRAYSEAVGVKLAGVVPLPCTCRPGFSLGGQLLPVCAMCLALAGRKSGVKLEVKLRGGVRPSGAEQWSKRVVDSWAAVDSLAARSGAVAAAGPTGTPFDVTTEKRRFAFESELLDDVAIEQTELVVRLPQNPSEPRVPPGIVCIAGAFCAYASRCALASLHFGPGWSICLTCAFLSSFLLPPPPPPLACGCCGCPVVTARGGCRLRTVSLAVAQHLC